MSEPSPKRRHPLDVDPEPPAPAPVRRGPDVRLPITRPIVTPILLAILVLVYLAQRSTGHALTLRFMKDNDAIIRHGEYYRLFTLMFLHGSFEHLIFNGFALYAIGSVVERFFGSLRFVLIYFLGGLAASIVSLIFTPAPVVGASGAVFALVGADALFFYVHREMFGAAARRYVQNIVVIALMQLVLGFFSDALSTTGTIVDNWAHLGGLVGGLILAWFVVPHLQFQVTRPEGWQNGGPVTSEMLHVVDVNPLNDSWPKVAAFAGSLVLILLYVVLSWR